MCDMLEFHSPAQSRNRLVHKRLHVPRFVTAPGCAPESTRCLDAVSSITSALSLRKRLVLILPLHLAALLRASYTSMTWVWHSRRASPSASSAAPPHSRCP